MAEQPEHIQDADVDALRGPKRLLLWGSGGAMLLSFGTSALGAQGDAGLFLLLLLLALVLAVTGLWIAGRLLRDQFRGDPTPTRHGVLAVVLFVAAFVCMTASVGVASTLGSSA